MKPVLKPRMPRKNLHMRSKIIPRKGNVGPFKKPFKKGHPRQPLQKHAISLPSEWKVIREQLKTLTSGGADDSIESVVEKLVVDLPYLLKTYSGCEIILDTLDHTDESQTTRILNAVFDDIHIHMVGYTTPVMKKLLLKYMTQVGTDKLSGTVKKFQKLASKLLNILDWNQDITPFLITFLTGVPLLEAFSGTNLALPPKKDVLHQMYDHFQKEFFALFSKEMSATSLDEGFKMEVKMMIIALTFVNQTDCDKACEMIIDSGIFDKLDDRDIPEAFSKHMNIAQNVLVSCGGKATSSLVNSHILPHLSQIINTENKHADRDLMLLLRTSPRYLRTQKQVKELCSFLSGVDQIDHYNIQAMLDNLARLGCDRPEFQDYIMKTMLKLFNSEDKPEDFIPKVVASMTLDEVNAVEKGPKKVALLKKFREISNMKSNTIGRLLQYKDDSVRSSLSALPLIFHKCLMDGWNGSSIYHGLLRESVPQEFKDGFANLEIMKSLNEVIKKNPDLRPVFVFLYGRMSDESKDKLEEWLKSEWWFKSTGLSEVDLKRKSNSDEMDDGEAAVKPKMMKMDVDEDDDEEDEEAEEEDESEEAEEEEADEEEAEEEESEEEEEQAPPPVIKKKTRKPRAKKEKENKVEPAKKTSGKPVDSPKQNKSPVATRRSRKSRKSR